MNLLQQPIHGSSNLVVRTEVLIGPNATYRGAPVGLSRDAQGICCLKVLGDGR